MFRLVMIQCVLRLQREKNKYVKRTEKLAECLSFGSDIVPFLVFVCHTFLSESRHYNNISISTPVYRVSAPKFCLATFPSNPPKCCYTICFWVSKNGIPSHNKRFKVMRHSQGNYK
jgi:hypothetical protein